MKDKFMAAVENITTSELRTLANYCLGKLPEHFWTQPSSSSGKYHPEDEHGPEGLALHTLRVMKIAEILIKAAQPPIYVDAIRLAAMFHDAARYGLNTTPTSHSLKEHPELSAIFLMNFIIPKGLTPALEVAYHAILTHMGKWGKYKPESPEDWIVHYADIIASQYTPGDIST